MKILKYILLLVLILVIGGAIYMATLDGKYHVTRSKVINAPVSVVFSEVNDFKKWPAWSPWIEQEPNATLTYEDKTVGEGAGYAWKGKVIGEGNMKTKYVKNMDSISQEIYFKDYDSTSDVYWTFKPVEGGTKVTWGMKGEFPFIARPMAAGMDDSLGPDYERGLFKLDSVINSNISKYSVKVDTAIVTHSGGYYLYSTASCKIDALEAKMKEMMPKVMAFATKNKVSLSGAPYTLLHKYDVENNAVIFSSAVPTTDRVIAESSEIQTGMLQPFKAVKTTLTGDYKNLQEAWETTMKYIADNKIETIESLPSLEVYQVSIAKNPNPAEWVTEIYVPVK